MGYVLIVFQLFFLIPFVGLVLLYIPNLSWINSVVQYAEIGYISQNQGSIVKNRDSIIGCSVALEKILNFYKHHGKMQKWTKNEFWQKDFGIVRTLLHNYIC